MCSGGSHTPSRVRGFPIRTSTDRSLVGSSPWLFAATHVLHRHQAPRHPPLALCSLENQRCSCSLWNSQGTGADSQRTPQALRPAGSWKTTRSEGSLPQNGTEEVRLGQSTTGRTSPTTRCRLLEPNSAYIDWESADRCGRQRLLRKEVIQPHLPV